ncbi:MAG: hypothetical protein WAN61_01020 [Minisyncoccia bacterium]
MEKVANQPNILKDKNKKALVEELKDKIVNNVDFISPEIYKSIFSRFDLKGAKILDVGAGFIPVNSQASQYINALPIKDLTLVPFDINDLKIRSWNLVNRDKPLLKESMVRPVRGDMFNLPLDQKRMETELKKVQKLKNKKSSNKVTVKVVAPFGLLLRK